MTPSVLVVEDEPAIQELLRVNLVDAGYEVRAAPDAESAQRELNEALPTLLLLDWMLPGKSGLALAKELRASTRTREVANPPFRNRSYIASTPDCPTISPE